MKFLGALCIACAAGSVAAAAHAQTSSPQKKRNDTVIVRGCVSGRTLVADRGTGGVDPLRYDLTGSKEILEALAKHSRHTEEITGKVKGGDASGATRVVEKRWGKNRVYAGAADSMRETPQIASGPAIEVTSFEHLADACL
jgi:hypothetical protein